jgi:hypothetical protein
MHVFIVRWCPAFSETGDGVVGQHEFIEREIRTQPLPLQHTYSGHAFPFASEFKLIEYRMKKEAVGDFLAKLQAINLVPKTNPPKLRHVLIPRKLWWILRIKPVPYFEYANQIASLGKKGLWAMVILGFLSRRGLWLQSVDASSTVLPPYYKMGWAYNFCIGVLPDIEFTTATGEKYESL